MSFEELDLSLKNKVADRFFNFYVLQQTCRIAVTDSLLR